MMRSLLRRFLTSIVGEDRLNRLLVWRRYKRFAQLGLQAEAAQKVKDDTYWAGRLRKCAHIVDKGLQRADFEPGHSKRWYDMAVQALEQIRGSTVRSDPSVTWAREKLKEYENRQQNPSAVDDVEPPRSRCTSDDIVDLIRSRRSVRRFLDRPVTVQTVAAIVESINWSPTSCNRQPAVVYASINPEIVARCMQTCAGATGFSGAVPLFLCFAADLRVYDMPNELLLPTLDTALGIENCILVAHSLGVGLSVLSWAQHTPADDAMLRSTLGLPEYCQIIVNAVGGYAARGAALPSRKSLGLTLHLKE